MSYLKVGPCLVDISRREITAAGQPPHRITVKALQVLLALAEKPGQVITRDYLMQHVWPHTLPTEHVLTQAIVQLRKALNESHDAPKYFETISRGGYRLLAPVEWLEEVQTDRNDKQRVSTFDPSTVHERDSLQADNNAPPELEGSNIKATVAREDQYPSKDFTQSVDVPDRLNSKRAQQRMAYFYSSLACAVVATLIATTVFFRAVEPEVTQHKTPEIMTIAHSPALETRPNLSPDGKFVTYVYQSPGHAAAMIMMQRTAQSLPKQISYPPLNYRDDFPVWSPDGRRISFVRRSSGTCHIFIIDIATKKERQTAACHESQAHYYSWIPDGSGLVMGNLRTIGERSSPLRILNFDSGEWRALKYPIAAGDIDFDPRYSPDGRSLAFHRNTPHSNLLTIRMDKGSLERLTNLESTIRTWDWLPDNSGLVFNPAQDKNALYQYRFRDRASRLIGNLGRHPDVATHAPVLVFELRRNKAGLFRYRIGVDNTIAHDPQRIFASSGSERTASVSPDGRRIAFLTDRSSADKLWIADLDDPESAQPIEDFMPNRDSVPVWSPDNKEIWIMGSRENHRQIFVIDVNSRKVRRIPIIDGEPFSVSFMGRPDKILVSLNAKSGPNELVYYNIAIKPWRRLATLKDVASAKFSPENESVFFTKYSETGLFKTGMNLKNIELINSDVKLPLRWDISDNKIVYVSKGVCQLWWMELKRKERNCLESKQTVIGQPDIDSTGHWVYTSLALDENIDIGLVDLTTQ